MSFLSSVASVNGSFAKRLEILGSLMKAQLRRELNLMAFVCLLLGRCMVLGYRVRVRVWYCELKVQVLLVLCCCEAFALLLLFCVVRGKGTGSSSSEVLSPVLIARFVFKAGCKTEDQSSDRNRLCMSPFVWVCASFLMGFRFSSYGF